MIATLLSNQQHRLDTLAELWLEAGAGNFSLWNGETMVAHWGTEQAANGNKITAPIMLDGATIGTLQVVGLNGKRSQKQLSLEAAWLAELAQFESDMDVMTAELVESQDQIVALYNLTQSTRTHLDVDEMFRSLIAELRRLIKAEGVFIALDVGGRPTIIKQYPQKRLDEATIQYFFERCDANGFRELLIHFEEAPRMIPTGIASMFLVPMPIRENAAALLGFMLNEPAASLSPTLKLARAIAKHVGAQIDNVLLHQETLDQARLKTELELASQIQLRLLPQSIPNVPGLDLAATSRPALHVGGDFYDLMVEADSPFIFVIGDVSGKGTGAALLMAMTRSVIRSKAMTKPVVTPADILRYATEVMEQDFHEVEMFVSLFIAQFDTATRQLTYANAGHSPVVYYPAGGSPTLLQADGPVMGALPISICEDFKMTFAPNDLLVLATDGINEARNPAYEMFGTEAMLSLVANSAHRSAAEILEIIYRTIDTYGNGSPQADDQTLIVVKGTEV